MIHFDGIENAKDEQIDTLPENCIPYALQHLHAHYNQTQKESIGLSIPFQRTGYMALLKKEPFGEKSG